MWLEFRRVLFRSGNVVKSYLEENDILTPVIVLLELSYLSDKEGWEFFKYLNFIKINSEIVGINEKFILSFGKFYNKIKKQTKKIGITDVIIMHTAVMKDAKILTGDKHFSKTDNVIILWLSNGGLIKI